MKNASTAAVVWWKVAAALGECTSSAYSVTFYSSCRAKVCQSQFLKPPAQKVSRPPRFCPPLSAPYCLTMSLSDRFVCIPFILIESMFSHFLMPPFPGALIPTPCFHTSSHTPLRSQCQHVLLLQTFLLHLPRFKASERGLGLVRGVRGRSASWTRDYRRLEHKLFHRAQPSSMVFGWAGLTVGSRGGKDTCGRVPVVGRPARQPPGRVGVGWRPKAVLLP